MNKNTLLWVMLVVPLLVPGGAAALTADEIMKKSQAAFLYPGSDFKARVSMKLVSKGGQERVREMMMLRKELRRSRRGAEVFHVFLPTR
jgi:hypothetical protein